MHLNLHKIREIQLYLNFHLTSFFLYRLHFLFCRGDIFDESSGRREFTFKRTIKYDSHMLDKPDFVGSYDVGEYVYFFFRETAVEFMNCGKTIYSRIARVCKKDIGGKNILHQNWVTYLKARLNCSIPGDFPFFFDEIQDVYKAASGSSSNNEEIFHAVFTTNQNGLKGSAICSFNLKDINNVFDNGKFKEQATSTSMWLPVPTKDVPEPRPGMHTYLFWIMNSTNEVVECIIQKRK